MHILSPLFTESIRWRSRFNPRIFLRSFWTIKTCFFFFWLICLVGRVFANGPEVLGSNPGRVIPKALKMVLDTSLLNTQQYKVRIKVKWSNPGKGVAPSPTLWCSSYLKRSHLVALDYGRQLYYFFVSPLAEWRCYLPRHWNVKTTRLKHQGTRQTFYCFVSFQYCFFIKQYVNKIDNYLLSPYNLLGEQVKKSENIVNSDY